MGLADDLRQAQSKAKPGCTVAALYHTLDPEDAEALRKAIDTPVREFSHAELVRILKANGHTLATSTIGRHRNGGCCCGPR